MRDLIIKKAIEYANTIGRIELEGRKLTRGPHMDKALLNYLNGCTDEQLLSAYECISSYLFEGYGGFKLGAPNTLV